MSLQVFAAGDKPQASKLNAVSRQTVIVCTSSTRPGSPDEGMMIYETDTDKVYVYNGSTWVQISALGAWESYTPTWGGAVTLGSGTSTGSYTRSGNSIKWRAVFTYGSGSAIGSAAATVTLPVTAVATEPAGHGTAHLYDASATNKHYAAGMIYGTTTVEIRQQNTSSLNDRLDPLSSSTPFTWTTGDKIIAAGEYEPA